MVDTPTPTPDAPWHAGMSAEDVGFLQTRGWDKLDAKTATIEALKAYRGAAANIGAPPEKMLRLPDNMADGEAMKPIWQKLGAPADAKGYDLSALKLPNGQDLDPKFVEFIQQTAFSRQLTKDAALGLAADLVKRDVGAQSEDLALRTGKLNEEKAALAKEWGPNAELFKVVAQQAARALGVSPETVQALENQVGYKAVMEMFRNIGSKIGEDKFILNQAPGGSGVMTQSQAISRKAELSKDTAWVTKYLAGDSAAMREMTSLNQIIVSQQA